MNNVFSLGQHKLIVQIDQSKGELPKEVKTEEVNKKEEKKEKEEKSKDKKPPVKKGTGKKKPAKKEKENDFKKDKELDFFSVKGSGEIENASDGESTDGKGNGK